MHASNCHPPSSLHARSLMTTEVVFLEVFLAFSAKSIHILKTEHFLTIQINNAYIIKILPFQNPYDLPYVSHPVDSYLQ